MTIEEINSRISQIKMEALEAFNANNQKLAGKYIRELQKLDHELNKAHSEGFYDLSKSDPD